MEGIAAVLFNASCRPGMLVYSGGRIPRELGLLTKLKILFVGGNRLTGAIPQEFGELKDLHSLDLANNQLSAIGGVQEAQWLLSKFAESPFNYFFDLRGNPWRMPPEAVVENGMVAVKRYYTDVQMAIEAGAKVTFRRHLKVVLVGLPSAGKTSLMKSIISKRANRTEGTPEETSTEGIEVRPHQLGKTSVEFYDCAGQVDYGGMHQVFLTRRALFLLVWDITKCTDSNVGDFDKVIHDSIMRWLYTLHLRAPGATVLLVANKIDRAVNDAAETARRVEQRVRIVLQEWEDRRGLCHNVGYGRGGNGTQVVLLDESSLISCDNYDGIPSLIKRVLDHYVSSIEVPPAWELALEFINALRCKHPPERACLEYLQIPVSGENTGTEWSDSFITKEELRSMWRSVMGKAKDKICQNSKGGLYRVCQDVVGRVTDRASGIGNETAVYNSDSALDGALWISEFAGQILLVEDGEGIFLDVVWLSKLVTPILSHKLKDSHFLTAGLNAMKNDLVEDKILRWEFARYLWKDIMSHSSLQSGERAAHTLYSVLIKLGVILPLGTRYRTSKRGASLQELQSIHETSSHPPDMLVLMRLRETPDYRQLGSFDDYTADVPRGAREVTLKWKFDAAGAPYGLIERLIASCHVIGVAERNLCWRYGALFRSRDMTERFGRKTSLFKTVIRYDPIHGSSGGDSANVLTVRMIGPLESQRVWAAIRFVASAIVTLSKEWPGAIFQGWPVCPTHPTVSAIIYLTTPIQANIGSPLIPETVRGDRNNGCFCYLENGEVLGHVVKELGVVVDISKDPFEGLPVYKTPLCNDLQEMIIIWRPYACSTAVSLWALVVVLFGGVTTGIVEEKHAFWQMCVAVMIISFVGAIASSVVVYRDMRHHAAKSKLRQSAGLMRHDDGLGDIEAMPLMGSSYL